MGEKGSKKSILPTKSMLPTKLQILIANDKAVKRIIAPYVRILRKGQKLPSDILDENKQFSHYLQKKPSVLLRDLSTFLSDSVDLPSLLHETADVLKTVTKASGVNLYLVDNVSEEIYQSQKEMKKYHQKIRWPIQEGTIVAAFVALKKEYVMVDDVIGDERFPEGIGYGNEIVKSVLCVPVVTLDGDCFAVIELNRQVSDPPFTLNDLKITIVVTGWMGAAIHQNQQRLALQKQQELNDYLLELTKCYFGDETILLERMVTEIIKFAKATLNAERGSFFIIDKESDELVADLFDEGIDETSTPALYKKHTKIRFGKERGIAGLVARTGEMINVRDAYNDPRFNNEIDEKTGFITRSILCMPVMGIDGILGVVQVVNKKTGGCFTVTDENLFKTFSVYSALALHYTKTHNSMEKNTKRDKVLRSLLQMHVRPCIHDADYFLANKYIPLPEHLETFKWYIGSDQHHLMPQITYYMITTILGSHAKRDETMLFILSVRKLYRNNPFHNFEHAFNVCHCMFVVLKLNLKEFTDIERFALIIATICHDIDHYGYTNNFLEVTKADLAQLYNESILENHHYYVTNLLLEGCNIFQDLTQDTTNAIMWEIKQAILATDLATYFKYRSKLITLISEQNFDMNDNYHRQLMKSIIMTSCDLSANCKPFPIAKRIVELLLREFYNQGDKEKSLGMCPLSLMDREQANAIPNDQVQFLNVVVIPCVDLLRMMLPSTINLYRGAVDLRNTWQNIIDMTNMKTWSQEKSLPKE